ncbi:MAG TPA: hypothetical protein VH143_31835 [Kofleriaceae bacterium]|nr:hypothetical protein [Kofleriaceae bacterium]
MRDLELFRRLRVGSATPAELAIVAAWPMNRRGPLLGAVLALASSPDPELRAGVMRTLSGSRGVAAVRALVAGLDDEAEVVRDAALAALRHTANAAPARYAHALFHRRPDVRRAAMTGELPRGAAGFAAYLRADPSTAELAERLAWPEGSLALAFDLYETGSVAPVAFAELVANHPNKSLRAALEQLPVRDGALVIAMIDDAIAGRASTGSIGRDAFDTIADAIGRVSTSLADRLVAKLVPLARAGFASRIAAALLTGGNLALAAVFEPRLIASPQLDEARAHTLAAALVRLDWPVRPHATLTERLLALPIARDLAIGAAIAGLLPKQRLATLAAVLGDTHVASCLIASDRGWAEICALPGEIPALELGWLVMVRDAAWPRYLALVGLAIARFDGNRLGELVKSVLPRHRAAVFSAALAHVLDDPDAQTRVFRAAAAAVLRYALFPVLEAALAAPPPHRLELVLSFLRACSVTTVAEAVTSLGDSDAITLVGLLDPNAPPGDAAPREHELAIAAAFADRTAPAIAAWRGLVTTTAASVAAIATPPMTGSRHVLADAERRIIATCPPGGLARALAGVLAQRGVGVTVALAPRAAGPNPHACSALVGSADPITDVAHELDRFAASGDDALDELEAVVSSHWSRRGDLSPIAHACLYRWEAHTFALAGWIADTGGALATLAAIETLPGRIARRALWRGVAETLMFLRYRDQARFAREATAELAAYCADRIAAPIGRYAARVLIALVESGAIAVASIRDRIFANIAEADPITRGHIARFDRIDGLPTARARAAAPDAGTIAQIRASRHESALIAWCRSDDEAIAAEAVLALLALGASGQRALANLSSELHGLAHPIAVLASVVLWDDEIAIGIARARFAGELAPAWQFHLGLGLAGRGDVESPGALARALDAARIASADWTFRKADWDAVARLAGDFEAALALADSPHYHAYRPAIKLLLDAAATDDVLGALVRFVEVDDERVGALRRGAARRLADHGDDRAIAIVAAELADDAGDITWMLPAPLAREIAELVADSALIGGPEAASEKRMTAVCSRARKHVAAGELGALDARILDGAITREARKAAAARFVGDGGRDRIERVADVFAWGIRRGVELTGRRFRIHPTAAEREFGYTRLDESRVFVNVLPLLRGDLNGRDIVEGLVLHELGHHVYHRAPASLEIWKRAQTEGLHHLLNVVADEHLERNLRARDGSYGDRLKRLGAYAFRHAPQEITVATLVRFLRARAAPVLITSELEVAFDEACVRVRRGALLAELDRQAHPLARFTRALRLGLGNRSGDPVLAQALALVAGLRDFDMAKLYEVTKQLAALFGGATEIAEVFCSSESLEDGDRERDVHGADLDDGELQREVERILDPRSRKSAPRGDGPPRPWVNVNPSEEFDRISTIERVRADKAAHAAVVLDVSRHSARLRGMLDDLGLRWQPQRARTQGRAIDRTRLIPLVTRNDPRLLVARVPTRVTDLFLGVLVDCSDSMKSGNNLDRARRFAIMVAEAVRPLRSVDARFFGFSDTKIFDAGTATECDVAALHTSGGNNDAAALFHAANVALASPRRARVLVMISDGLPTDCSVAALRGLVTQLSRRKGIVCAQVAVRPIEEVCFPHYVVLDGDLEAAVARFGRVVGDLVRRSLLS